MRNLIPRFIHDNYRAGIFSGQFDAVAMFADISGFTAMTETLMTHGDEGAEVLSDILNAIFSRAVEVIYRHGGFVVNFAGDAFTALFPVEKSEIPAFFEKVGICALNAAQRIQRLFKREGLRRTRLGDFQLQIRLGLAPGAVEWGIVGGENKAFFFRGEAINACVAAEHQARAGEIILSTALLRDWPADAAAIEPTGPHFARLLGLKRRTATPPAARQSRSKTDILRRFLTDALLDFSGPGEFRNVVSLFISFDGVADRAELDAFICLLIELEVHYRAYLKEVDFGDKGGVAVSFFGAPVSFEKNVERALDFVEALRHQVQPGDGRFPGLRWRAGLTYGRTFAGMMGGRQRVQYTVLGSVVNLAARLMAAAGWGEVWVNEKVYRLCQREFDFVPLGAHFYKGLAQPMETYRLKGLRVTDRPIFHDTLIGREAEIERLLVFCRAIAVTGRFGGVYYIYGEAGAGKSRLISAVGERLEPALKAIWLQCDGIMMKSMNPFVYFMNHLFEQTPTQSPAENKANFERTHATFIARLTALPDPRVETAITELKRTQSLLGAMLAHYWDDSLFARLDPPGRFENTGLALTALFQGLSLLQPIVLVLEDFHWLETASRLLWQMILPRLGDFPVTMLAMARPNADGTLPRLLIDPAIPVLEMTVGPLPDDALPRLVAHYLDGAPDDALMQVIRERTNGNLFFVEQFCAYLKENHLVQRTAPNRVKIHKLKRSHLPMAIADTLISRLDQLTEQLKSVIQIASVLGHEFEAPLLTDVIASIHRQSDAEMTDLARFPAQSIEGLLTQARSQHIWSPLTEIQYIFSHALLRDAVYNMQLKNRLRQLHKLAAEALEKRYGEVKTRYCDIAYHYMKAEMPDRVREYRLKAGDYARSKFENRKAVYYYWLLLESLKEDDSQPILKIDTLLKFGDALGALNYKDECRQAFEEARTLAEKIGDGQRVAAVWGQLGQYYLRHQDLTQAENCFRQQQEISAALGDSEIATALGNLGRLHEIRSEMQMAEECYRRAHEIFIVAGEDRQAVEALLRLGQLQTQTGELERALTTFQQGLAVAEAPHLAQSRIAVLGGLAQTHWALGQTAAAQTRAEQELHLAKEWGDTARMGEALLILARVFVREGQIGLALAFFERAAVVAKESGHKNRQAEVLLAWAEALLSINAPQMAEEHLRAGLELARGLNDSGLVRHGEALAQKDGYF